MIVGQQFTQPSLGKDFDTFHFQMSQQAHKRGLNNGPGPQSTVSVSSTDSAAENIERTGRISNMFDPDVKARGTRSSEVYSRNRTSAERALFDIPDDAPHTQRPVYGYLRHNEDVDTGPYGNVVFDVYPGARKMTTTSTDSLDDFVDSRSRYMPPRPTPSELKNAENNAALDVGVEDLTKDHEPEDSLNYREVQLHGGPLSLKDVSQVHIFDDSPIGTGLRERFRKKGVRATTYMTHLYQPTLDKDVFGFDGKWGHVNSEMYSLKGPQFWQRKPSN